MTQTIPLKATLLLRHKRILRHCGTHLNWRLREQRGVYCSTSRSALYGVRASASHFDPALGTRERNESFSLFLSIHGGERVQHALHCACYAI